MNYKDVNEGSGLVCKPFSFVLKYKAKGQSMIEFVVICAALVAALFVPVIDDVSGGRRMSTVQLLIDNLQQGYQRTSGALSLPE
jgi:hypothetical protein